MATNREDGQLRLYLLGGLPEEECTALEEKYVRREEALDRVRGAEDDLIDDYLAGRLTADERRRFDSHYLASPVHRHRVAMTRQLRSAAARSVTGHTATPAPTSRLPARIRLWLEAPFAWTGAVTAALLVALAGGAAWMVLTRFEKPGGDPAVATGTTTPTQASGPDAPTPGRSRPAPVALAISLSPAVVRSAADSAPVTIPPGTERLDVNLESDGSPRPFSRARAVVQTVSGRDVWSGPAVAEASAASPVYARIEVPADRLAPDDYIVTVFETRDGGPETEGFRYFLRIRAR